MANAVEDLFSSNAAWVEGLALRWAERRGIHGAAADDYASVAAVTLWKACEVFDGRGLLRPYIVQRVRWALTKEWRRGLDRENYRLRSLDAPDADGEAMLLREVPAPFKGFETVDLRDRVEAALNLYPKHRQLIELVFMDGLSMADAGVALGRSHGYCSFIFKRLGIQAE